MNALEAVRAVDEAQECRAGDVIPLTDLAVSGRLDADALVAAHVRGWVSWDGATGELGVTLAGDRKLARAGW